MAKKKRTSASRRAAPANRQQGRDTDQHRRALRNQRIVLVFAISVLALFVISMGLVLTGTDSAAPPEGSPTSTSSTTSVPEPGGGPPPTAAGPPIEVPSIPAGERLDGPTPCPAPDGSSPRVTSFAEPPPRCIDADRNYNVTVTTSVGDLDFLMSAPQGPDAVNNFVVLARYHYYDGLPLVSINPTKEFTVVPSFDGEPASPGYPVPTEARETIVTPGALALPGVGEPGRTSGGFKVSLGEDALAWSEDSPILAFLLDGMETLQAIRMAGTPTTGEPTGLITIESITITEGTEARSVEG